MAVLARKLNDTFVNAAPPSLLRGGVYVPFSSPHLMIARLRLDDEGRPTALVPALSGGHGYYVVPWPMLPDLINMTVYDRALHESLASILHTDPIIVRQKALEVRQLGLCGPGAAEQAVKDAAADTRRRQAIFCHLVQTVAIKIGRPIEGLTPESLHDEANLAALRGLAERIDLAPDALIECLDAWASQLCLLGTSEKDLRGPVRQQLSELRAMLSVMGEWASNDHPEYVGSAKRCLAAGDAIMDLIRSQIGRIDNECGDALTVVRSWQTSAPRLRQVAAFATTAVQIWYAATVSWRAAAALRDRHEMRARIGFIESLLPVLAPSDMLKFQRNRVANDAGANAARPARLRSKIARLQPSNPAGGLREAIVETDDEAAVLVRILCWPFRKLVREAGQAAGPGEIAHETAHDLARYLRRTWSARDVARFEAVLAAVDDPEQFEVEIFELRKTVHLMLVEWLRWNREGRGDDDMPVPVDVPEFDAAQTYAATLMVMIPQIYALMGALPRPPITWLTIDNMRAIGASLEEMARSGYPLAAVGALHLVMQNLTEPCEIVQTLRHLTAHHGPSVTDQDEMRSIVDALLVRVGKLGAAIVEAADSFDGSPALSNAIDRYVDAIDCGILSLPLRQDGGVTMRVSQINREVAEAIRTGVLERLDSFVADAFPSCADPFTKDAQGMITNLNAAPSLKALRRIEVVVDLSSSLRDKQRLFGLNGALDACKLRASTAAGRSAERLREAVSRTGAAQSPYVLQHIMSTVWAVEQTLGSDQADRLRMSATSAVRVEGV
ncbi:MAG: hypothetical protein R3F55_22705 [Alphaproteobacteria bacterium]